MNLMRIVITTLLALCASAALADEYLGKLSANPYNADSTGNAYGQHGSQYSGSSINNPYGEYDSKYSSKSATNPYATDAPNGVYPNRRISKPCIATVRPVPRPAS